MKLIFGWGRKGNDAGQQSPFELAWGQTWVWQGLQSAGFVFTFLLNYSAATLFAVLKAHRAAMGTSFPLMITSQCHQCWGTATQACLLLMSFKYSCHSVSSIGWPKLQWFVTANLNRHPKDWQPPSNLDRSSPAYIEVSLKLMFYIIVVLVTIIMESVGTHGVNRSHLHFCTHFSIIIQSHYAWKNIVF